MRSVCAWQVFSYCTRFDIHWEDSPETDRMSEVAIIHQYVYALVSALRSRMYSDVHTNNTIRQQARRGRFNSEGCGEEWE